MKQVIKDNLWSDRIQDADRYYHEWEGLFKCDILERYYEGEQWKSQRELGYNPYTINKVYETMQIKIAEFVPTNPYFMVTPKPSNSDFDLEAASESAQLKQDILNQIITNENQNFSEEFELAYRDSFFRFGIVEVGYSADWILNPYARKPLKAADVDKQASNKRKIVEPPEELPANEKIYVKHIPAKRFRVGGLDHKYLSRCGWVGYWDWVNKDDLLSMKKLMNKDKIESIGGQERSTTTSDRNSKKTQPGSVKIWNIWDLRARLHLLILDDGFVTVFQRKFKRLPLFDYRPDKRLVTDGFYPIPPVFHWLSPQDEINETREMIRAHRRRFLRKYQALEGKVDDEELEKFETGPDGAVIKVKQENAITPIENADLGNALQEAIQTSADDLNRISGTSDPARGVSERGTATEANIVNATSSVRQKKDMERLVKWLSKIGREILLTVRDNFIMGFWVERTSPEGTSEFGEVQELQPTLEWVSTEKFEDSYDHRINVDVTSISVTAQEEEKNKFLQFTAYLQQFGPLVMFSPVLIQEAAYRFGYRNMKVIRAFQKQAMMAELMRMKGMQMPQGNAGQQINANQLPPQNEQIQNQMTQQLRPQ